MNEFNNEENLKYAQWYYGHQERSIFSSTYNFLNNKNWLSKGSVVAAYQNIKESRNNRKFESLTLNSQSENVKVYSLNLDFVGF